MPDIDAKIVATLKEGDITALEKIYSVYAEPIYNLALRMLGTKEDGEDLLQDVFIIIFRKIKNYRGQGAFKNWIYQIATNLCLDKIRRRKKIYFTQIYEDIIPDENSDIARKIETDKVVQNALNTLPSTYRICLVMKDMQGLSYEEIARSLKMKIGTVKSNVSRARDIMRKKIKLEE